MCKRVLIGLVIVTGNVAQAQTSFTRGHIFVAVTEPENCEFGGREWIVEIDPQTGNSWVFADSNDGLCVVSGLRFTPDGTKLLAVNFGTFASGPPDGGWVQAFNPDGTSEIILDATDSLQSPLGSNALAFDAQGNLHLLSGDNLYILKFNGLNGPPTIFADSSDGVSFRGGLDFAPSGNLYYARWSGAVLRFSPDGQVFMFDNVGPRAVAVDRFGNVFTPGNGTINRFDCEDSLSEHVIASGMSGVPFSLALSPNSGVLYVAGTGALYALHPTTGNPVLAADLTYLTNFGPRATGMTVFAPLVFGDVDADGDVDLADVSVLQNCRSAGENANDCSCVPADLNRDAQYDLLDWQEMANNLSGP